MTTREGVVLCAPVMARVMVPVVWSGVCGEVLGTTFLLERRTAGARIRSDRAGDGIIVLGGKLDFDESVAVSLLSSDDRSNHEDLEVLATGVTLVDGVLGETIGEELSGRCKSASDCAGSSQEPRFRESEISSSTDLGDDGAIVQRSAK